MVKNDIKSINTALKFVTQTNDIKEALEAMSVTLCWIAEQLGCDIDKKMTDD